MGKDLHLKIKQLLEVVFLNIAPHSELAGAFHESGARSFFVRYSHNLAEGGRGLSPEISNSAIVALGSKSAKSAGYAGWHILQSKHAFESL